MKKYIYILLASFCFLVLCTNKSYGQFSQYELKAGFIYNFAKFTTWPPYAFKVPTEKITICIIGEDPFGSKIEHIFRGRPVHGRYWEIRRVSKIKDLWGSHIIFVCNSEKDRLKDILDYCRKHEVLTIADNIDNFCSLGGIINFTTNDKYNFEVNIETAKQVKLVLDANLLRLADRVVTPRYAED